MPPKKPPDVSASSKVPNEYIPAFISKKPFYVDDESSTNDYLEHQRLQKTAEDNSKWYDRGKRQGPAATKFRKGACENCGSMTHKTKECLSRPRKQGARWTGKDIQADEVVQDVRLGWDAKRDRWNGYDASQYGAVVQEYEMLEEIRKQAKGEQLAEQKQLEDGVDDDEGEEAKYAEESDMGRQQSKATRQLRLREDTAKYLLNLDLDSAKYDPKTRSLVDSGATVDQAAALVAEESFMRASGDAAEFEKATRYAWESQERGDKNKQHVQANPTSGEYFRRKQKEEVEAKREALRKALIEKYGDQPVPSHALAEVALTESERYVEYDERGLIKGAPKTSVKSKYPEDVMINNHTSVWGSWWSDFKWGYACCHSTVRNSYCTGEEGKLAFEEAEKVRTGGALEAPMSDHDDERDGEEVVRATEKVAHKSPEEATTRVAVKRTLEEMKGGVTEEELDAYRRKRTVADDPMAAFLGKDELVH
ncbi:MAG: Tabersonine 6,7-epoxidase isoform 2 [Watsoniomyces obsoletus]|nr:MAG: Tabersonine 6,7-epoxidase isoform 2 [Watsoniomyces obsoletus]